jgi:hypothetical protein
LGNTDNTSKASLSQGLARDGRRVSAAQLLEPVELIVDSVAEKIRHFALAPRETLLLSTFCQRRHLAV